MGDRYNESNVLTHLGDVQRAFGDVDGARQSWQRAQTILLDLKHHDTEQVRIRLERVS